MHLLAAMPDHLRAAVEVAVYAGLRRSEILRLKWEHIDLKAGVLTVTKTKSNKDRKVPISDDLAELLRRHPRKLGNRLLFPASQGKVERHDIRTSLRLAARRAGIELVGMHQLRHAFCSHALMSGIPASSVQQWMGHASLATTERYAHTSPEHEQEAIQRVRYSDDDQAERTSVEGSRAENGTLLVPEAEKRRPEINLESPSIVTREWSRLADSNRGPPDYKSVTGPS